MLSRFGIALPVALCCTALAANGLAATDVRVSFTLNTTDTHGAPLQQNRFYYVYRPDNLPKTAPVPMVLVTDCSGPAMYLHRKADQAGFLVVSCAYAGNSTGAAHNGDPKVAGYEDYDYFTEVIKRVRESENANDAFTVGFSAGGHTSLAYACVRPAMLKAASSVDEFMGLTSNIPSAPLPIIMFEGTSDAAVGYTPVKDTLDAWRTLDGLLDVKPVTTYEASPLIPGQVSQATWRGGTGGTQVAFVTIVGGNHGYPLPGARSGYDFTDSLWVFFSQFLTTAQASPKIVSQPVDNIQIGGQPASFWVAATGAAPMRIQWQKNGVNIPRANATWFTTAATAPADNGAKFRAVIGNDSGSVTSALATLTVNEPPAGPIIKTQPADRSAVAGQPVTFTVAAAGAAPLTYQWMKNGVKIVGATGASLNLPAIVPDCGASFTVVVTDSSGSTTSTRAMLAVTPAPGAPLILKNPERARVAVGQKAAFSVTAKSASPMSYQWQTGTGIMNMADIPGATKAEYETPSVTPADDRTLFRCVVSNASGNATSASEYLLLPVAAKK